MGELIRIADYKKVFEPLEDDAVKNEAVKCVCFIVLQLESIRDKFGIEAAYKMYAEISYLDINRVKIIVDTYLEE